MDNRIFDTVPFPGDGSVRREGLRLARCARIHIALGVCVLFFAAWCGLAEAGPKVTSGAERADRGIIVDYGHHKIHDGESFCVSNTVTLGNGGKALILVNTPEYRDVHLLISTRATAEGNLEVWEGTSVSAHGTALEANNHNRKYADDTKMIWTKTPTFTSIGTLLPGLTEHFGAGQTTGERVRGIREIVLKRKYLYLINTVSEAANNEITSSFDYYLATEDAP